MKMTSSISSFPNVQFLLIGKDVSLILLVGGARGTKCHPNKVGTSHIDNNNMNNKRFIAHIS